MRFLRCLYLPICASLLLLAGEVHAKAKRHVSPAVKPAPLLTTLEQFCAAGGVLASAVVIDRNNLVPLTTTASNMRIILRTLFQAFTPEQRGTMTEQMIKMTYGLYAAPRISPAEARHGFEIGCLNPEKANEALPTQVWR